MNHKIMNRIKNLILSLTLISFVCLLLTTTGCEKDPKGISSEDSIYVVVDELMHTWYLWYQEVPEVDIYAYNHPDDLIRAMAYRTDKWSFVEEKGTLDAVFQAGEDFGFGFIIRFDATQKLRVMLIYKDSEAYQQGIRKGNTIETINGISALAFDDYEKFFNDSPFTWRFGVRDSENNLREVVLPKETYHMDGVLYRNIYNIAGNQTGYLVYDSFLAYTEEELEETFNFFKTNNITELIVDLRYNGGGYDYLAKKLSEMIIPAHTAGSPLYSHIHNDIVGPEEDVTFYVAPNELNLDLNRVFFITAEFTASASELVINALEPYMDVYLIGSTTYGKPVGMAGFLFQDWYIYPVTSRLINSSGNGDYFNGLPVDQAAGEGLATDWGEEEDPNLSQAFHFIANGTFNDEKSAEQAELPVTKGLKNYMEKRNFLILDPKEK
jgi:carboxyl-terminal processing protease